jgi:hypothetical protein
VADVIWWKQAKSRWRDYAWLVPVLAGSVAIGFLCWDAWVYGHHTMDWVNQSHGWLNVVFQPGQDLTLVIVLLLWIIGLICYWWPRRRRHQPIGLIAVAVMVLLAVVLGTSSYLPCRGESSVIGVMFWVLQMFVGQPPSSVYAVTNSKVVCDGTGPLALQLGQDLGLGATLLGAATTVIALLWRDPLQRIQARFVRNAIVFTGLDERTLPLLLLLAQQASDSDDVVVIEPDSGNVLLEEARRTGARVVIGDPANPRLLRPIICGWRGCALRRLYALSARVQDNERVVVAARRILHSYSKPPDPLPHLMSLIDNPRHAESWRSLHGQATPNWFEDVLNSAEVTAVNLVNQLAGCAASRLLLCGDSSLALAILHELARRSWEQAELGKAAAAGQQSGVFGRELADERLVQPVRHVTLLDQRAADTRREYHATVHPEFIELDDAPEIVATAYSWRTQLLDLLDNMSPAMARDTAVIIVSSPDESSMHVAGRIARLHTAVPVFVQAPAGHSMPDAIFGQLRTFELGLLVDGHAAEDSWTRIARHWHECYRLSNPVPHGAEKADTRQPWDKVGLFVQQDNIMQVHSILSLVARLGRRWVPRKTVVPGSIIELSREDIERVAQMEHDRWLKRQPTRTNPHAVPWADLSEKKRRDNCALVADQIAQLEAMGFVPIVPKGGPPEAATYERVGFVQASRLAARRTWALRSGEQMQGNAGDWNVTDDDGNVRTVADREFRASYEPVDGIVWRRVGVCSAWQVHEAVRIRTKEGKATAQVGDWVLEAPGGERWPMRDEEFSRSYRTVSEAPVPASQGSGPVAAVSGTTPAVPSQ